MLKLFFISLILSLLLIKSSALYAGAMVQQRRNDVNQAREQQQEQVVTKAQQRQQAVNNARQKQVAAQQAQAAHAQAKARANQLKAASPATQTSGSIEPDQRTFSSSSRNEVKIDNLPPDTPPPVEVVTMAQVWDELEFTSELWMDILEEDIKKRVISKYISWYEVQGINILYSPSHYIKMVDAMFEKDPGLLKRPFNEVIRICAIMEYDFDNGQDKEKMALKLLGQGTYEENRGRMGLPELEKL